ncbi:MAG: branched-chain amino acid ABC transporter permease [Hyphomicrobiaceae bacterium]|jgi:branched-chain amino acid transport system permease protein
MADFFQFLFSGLTVGAVYALVALGFTLIYNASDVVNFAQGEFVMLGGMIAAFAVAAGVPLAAAGALAIVLTVLVGLLLHRLAIEPARGASTVTLIIITIGASLVLRGIAAIVFDKQSHGLPAFSGTTPVVVFGASVLPQAFWVMGGTVLVLVALWAFLARTLFGKAVLATAANRIAAQLVGVNTKRVMAFSFGASAGIGALAGLLITPITLTSYDVGTALALKGFAAAVLGGMGHPAGAVVGGLTIGLLEAFGAGYVSSAYKDAIAFIALIAVLIVLPGGLFGVRSVDRV